MSDPTTAALLLDALVGGGVTHLFCNLGTDHVALVEELAHREADALPGPTPVIVPHEAVAVHMAGGMAAMNGQAQAVLVHVDAGTANAAMGLHNLARARLPVMLMAGRAPYAMRGERVAGRDNYVHFIQDPFDIGSLVRPYVRWEYGLPSGAVVAEVTARGLAVAASDPAGPVFLTLPREVLEERFPAGAAPGVATRHAPIRAGGLDPAAAARIAETLLAARQPVLITSYAGRNRAVPALLADLAVLAGIAVVESMPHWLNLDRGHPCHAGFDPGALLADCDAGLLLDVDVPWLPHAVRENPATRWFHLDVDPLKRDLPLWGFAAEERHGCDAEVALRQILAEVLTRITPDRASAAAARVAALAAAGANRRAAWAEAATRTGTPGAIAVPHLCAALHRRLGPGDVVLNEAIRNTPAVLTQMPRDEAGTYIGLAGGGLGFSGGMALGVRMACPDRRVVQVVGDGGFHFMSPDSVFAVAQAYGLPFLSVVLDNGGWQAVKEAVLRVHPQGAAAANGQFFSRLAGPVRRFAAVGAAFGAHAEEVADPADLDAAIDRCFAALARGHAAVLHVHVTQL